MREKNHFLKQKYLRREKEKESKRKSGISEAAERFSSVVAVRRFVCLVVRTPNPISVFEDVEFWSFCAKNCVFVTDKRAVFCIDETFTAQLLICY
ncbi:hypothetical protein KFK09_013345 [Dendrobium nobile]|uniref:Uncharacterized protein n=1 Tax=Dendrobium nobile TaxID=94219 RepID=A0A8T3B729_DENNO|nr:hypothetical protein KFK09_013345 [Dendrobium nobile]